MKQLKKYLISLAITLAIIAILTLIVAILNYTNIMQNNTLKYSKLFIPIISIFISGIYIGKFAKEKGYLEGIKLGLIYTILTLILALLDYNNIKWTIIIYYLILILVSMLGSMIGINRKKTN